MFNPTLATFNKSSSVPIFGKMIVLADTSGSTNNVETRGRYSRRSYSNINVIKPSNTESDMPAENTTKPITIAISEGIAHTFAELANTFDMTGVKLVLGSFDSNYHQSVNAELKSSKELYDFATGSYFAPYLTTIGLYNEQQQLLAVGKLAQPLPLSPTTDTTILINIDR